MAKRTRGSPRALARSAARVRAFEQLVDRAIAGIPDPYRQALREVAILVEDAPSPDQLRENDIPPGDTMYGLYEGVPRTDYGADWAASPNRITLFRQPLEDICRAQGHLHRVVFAGRQPHARIPAFVAAMDIAVLLDSNTYGSPMKIFEYWGMGKPVVATRLFGIDDRKMWCRLVGSLATKCRPCSRRERPGSSVTVCAGDLCGRLGFGE